MANVLVIVPKRYQVPFCSPPLTPHLVLAAGNEKLDPESRHPPGVT